MSQVRVRPKHQITIPARIARAAGIKPDDVLDVGYANGVVTLAPAGRSARATPLLAYAGIARGGWGAGNAEIEAALAADRAAWER